MGLPKLYTAGSLKIGSNTARTQYESLSIKVQNALDGRWFESKHLTVNQFCGRASTLDTTLYLKATPDDRSAFESLTAQSCSVHFNNGVTGQDCTIGFHGQNTITALPYDLPLNQVFMQKLSLKNRFDPAAATDLEVSFA